MGVAPERVEVELFDLARRRLAVLAAAVAGVAAEEAGEAVEIAVAVLVVDVAALGAGDDRDLVVGPVGTHPREVHPEVLAGQLLKIGSCRRLRRGGHIALLLDYDVMDKARATAQQSQVVFGSRTDEAIVQRV